MSLSITKFFNVLAIAKKLTSERVNVKKTSKPSKPEIAMDNFSDFGTASGDDWSNF